MIERFVEAQKEVYNRALEEIKSGKKRTHWMWFIFPQIKGLGLSMTSIFYSIKEAEEAKEYPLSVLPSSAWTFQIVRLRLSP